MGGRNGNGAVWPPEWVRQIHLAATPFLPPGFYGKIELNFYDCGPTNANCSFTVKETKEIGIYSRG